MHKIKTFMNPMGGYLHICESCGHKWRTNEHSSAVEVAALYCPKCAEQERQAEKSPISVALFAPICRAYSISHRLMATGKIA